jgi:MoaA/NifB/PqqE/SkfB family radical SAM enzyme
MKSSDVIRAWKSILAGRPPSLSIEVTRECPLRCPGCYAYEDNHLGGGVTLRQLSDSKGDQLVQGILEIADYARPLHISLVGGDPLVRYREMEAVIPQLLARGIHVQLVTSAFRPLPAEWARVPGLTVAVSIDGLAPEHDVRRKPATYERILKNIEGRSVTVHCTVTAQMVDRDGYLDEFLAFWTARDEVDRVWFSLFTPQVGDYPAERLTKAQRERVVRDLTVLRTKYSKADMPARVLEQFLTPPSSPADCIFSRTTETISADLTTRITPCQFGGVPDCSDCGCYASMGLAAIGEHKLAGIIPVGGLFKISARIGDAVAARRKARRLPVAPDLAPDLADGEQATAGLTVISLEPRQSAIQRGK